jgi:hypothetical protein
VNSFGARLHRPVIFALFFLASVLYLAQGLNRGWVPMDDATLGLSADYVLQGELPHRDYFEGYTGGLTYVNALAFRIFGPKSMSLRYMMFLFALAWVPAVYYVASHFVSIRVAGPLTLLAVAWGVPNYSAPMPSWYNLFCATFGLAALLRYIEDQKPRWLVLAGFCGGASFLFKQIGLFFIAGAILFLLFRAQIASTKEPGAGQSRLYRIFLCTTLLTYALSLLSLILKRPNVITFSYFFVPAIVVGIPIVCLERHFGENRSHRFEFLFREVAFFLAGVALPIAIFLFPFIRGHAVPDLIRDVFVAPSKQIAYVGTTPTFLKFLVGVTVNALLFFSLFYVRRDLRKWISGLVLLAMAIALVLVRPVPAVYKAIFATIWILVPTLVICGSILVIRRLSKQGGNCTQKLFLMLSITAFCSLIQFPATAGIYFCYAAPLFVLAAGAVISSFHYQPRWFMVGAYCFALFYVVFEVTPGFVQNIGSQYEADTQTAVVNVPRSEGIRTSPTRAYIYNRLNGIVRQHARGEYIFATPDCPEVYFISGFRNPTRYFFDFWDDAPGRTQRILDTVHEHDINLVVVNRDPLASGPVASDLRTFFEHEFPNSALAGNFEVRWKR